MKTLAKILDYFFEYSVFIDICMFHITTFKWDFYRVTMFIFLIFANLKISYFVIFIMLAFKK